jgi:DeoR family transcriptional regulator, fructose operon transcriptional repressor
MSAAVRQRRIREMLESEEFLDLETLCGRLGASESTVRRDLTALESEGVLKRVYGGAMAMQTRDHALDFAWQSTHMADEKRRIAAATAKLIGDNETVILDGGSTVVEVARALAEHPLHVITNSLPIAEIFSDSRRIEVTLTGGYLYPRLRATIGPLCEEMLGKVAADTLVMGIGGMTATGFSNNNTLVVGPELKMIEASRRVIVVADHTKFGHGSIIHLAPLDVADIVVSDTALAPEFQEMLRAKDVEVLLA